MTNAVARDRRPDAVARERKLDAVARERRLDAVAHALIGTGGVPGGARSTRDSAIRGDFALFRAEVWIRGKTLALFAFRSRVCRS